MILKCFQIDKATNGLHLSLRAILISYLSYEIT